MSYFDISLTRYVSKSARLVHTPRFSTMLAMMVSSSFRGTESLSPPNTFSPLLKRVRLF